MGGKTIDAGERALGGETLKTLPGYSEGGHMETPRPSGTPSIRKRSNWGAIGSMVRIWWFS